MTCILILDIGTSSVKAALFGEASQLIAEAEAPHPTTTPADGRHEQDPDDWLAGVTHVCHALHVHMADVRLVVLAGTMQSVIAVDVDGKPLRPAILYSDSRCGVQFARLLPEVEQLGGASLLGNAPDPYLAAFKIAWMGDHEPEAFARTAIFHSGSKDHVLHWLTGVHATDATAATTVGLMDIDAQDWSPALLELFALTSAQMPAIRPADAIIGRVRDAIAATLGLPPGTPVMNGCGDAGASTLGAGIESPGETYSYVGTTAWVAQIVKGRDRQLASESIYLLAHPTLPGHYIRIGAMLSGGDGAGWFAQNCGRTLAELDADLDAPGFVPPRAMFLPYLKGERCPFMDADVRAAFLMLDRGDGPAQLHHAVIESIALALAANIAAIGPMTGALRLIGGGALSRHLPQLIADQCECTVAVAEVPGATTSFGVFRLGAAHLGWTVSRGDDRSAIAPRADPSATRGKRRALFARATAFARELARDAIDVG